MADNHFNVRTQGGGSGTKFPTLACCMTFSAHDGEDEYSYILLFIFRQSTPKASSNMPPPPSSHGGSTFDKSMSLLTSPGVHLLSPEALVGIVTDGLQ